MEERKGWWLLAEAVVLATLVVVRTVTRAARPPRGFHAIVEPDELDGGWVAECSELPGTMSQGETEREALDNLTDAISGVLSVKMQESVHRTHDHSPDEEHKRHKVALSAQ